MEEEPTRAVTNKTKPTASKSEVISSTKVLIDAAKSAFGNENEKIDKAKVADAAANVLEATSHYGKFEDNKFINKAEEYLHHYNSSHSPSSAATAHGGGGGGSGGGGSGGGDGGGGGGGYGEYLKMAQGMMHGHGKKDEIHHGGGGGGGGGGGYGEYMKMAQGILKK